MGIELFPVEVNSDFQLESRRFYIPNCMWWYMENLGRLETFNLTRSTAGYLYISSARCLYRRELGKDGAIVSPVSFKSSRGVKELWKAQVTLLPLSLKLSLSRSSSGMVSICWTFRVKEVPGLFCPGALQSMALCPCLPQYMQRLLSKQYCHCSGVSFPHFLNKGRCCPWVVLISVLLFSADNS